MAKKSSDREDCEPDGSSRRSDPPKSRQEKEPVAPVKEKIGEQRGNLRQRSDWFRQRSGGG